MEASPAIPGVVWGGFVARAFALEGAGLVDGTAEAFFVVCGDGRLALSEHFRKSLKARRPLRSWRAFVVYDAWAIDGGSDPKPFM